MYGRSAEWWARQLPLLLPRHQVCHHRGADEVGHPPDWPGRVAAWADTSADGSITVAEHPCVHFGSRIAGVVGQRRALGVVAPRGRLPLVLERAVDGSRIAAVDMISDPERLGQLHLAVGDECDQRVSCNLP